MSHGGMVRRPFDNGLIVGRGERRYSTAMIREVIYSVAKQLSQGVRLIVYRSVQVQFAIPHERQRRSRKNGLGETPPQHRPGLLQRIAMDINNLIVADYRRDDIGDIRCTSQ